MRRSFVILFFCVVTSAIRMHVMAQGSASLSGPTSGFVFDQPTRSIRPILGFPGSAHLGPASVSGVEMAVPAPNGRAALVIQDGQVNYSTDLGSGTLTSISDSVANRPDQIIWSRDSAVAILWWAGATELQRILFSDSGVTAEVPLVLSVGMNTRLAGIDGSGSHMLLLSSGDTPTLYLADSFGGLKTITGAANPSAAALSSDGSQVYVFDQATSQIMSWTQDGNAQLFVSLPGFEASSMALLNSKVLVVASQAGSLVRSYDLTLAALVSEDHVDVPPADLVPIPRGASLLNTRRQPGDAIFLMDANASVTFIPVE